MNRQRWLLVAILAASLGLRCIALQSRGIQYDDAFSILLSGRSLAEIVRGTAADTMPPLYYFLLHFWLLLGRDLWYLRLFSVLLSMGGVLLIFALVRELGGENAGIVAAALAGISPLQIYHAQDIRMYALLQLAQAGYLWCFARLWRRGFDLAGHWTNWLGLVAFGTLAMYTHNLAIFALVVPDVFLLLQRDWRRLTRLLAAQVLIGLLALPWLLMVPGQVAKIQGAFWTPRPGFVEIVQAIVMSASTLPLPEDWLGVGLASSLVILVVIILMGLQARRDWKHISLLILVILLPPVLLFAASYLMRPVFVPRGFLISTLGYVGLAGWLIARNLRNTSGLVLLIAFIAAAAISLPFQYTYAEFPRPPFDQAASYLETVVQPGDTVLHDNKLSAFPCIYFAPHLEQEFLPDERGSFNDTLAPATQEAMQIYPVSGIEPAVGGSKRVYFIVFQLALDEYAAAGGVHPQLNWLRANFTQSERRQFHDLLVYRFER